MTPILESAAPVSLGDLATQIRRSSNFRFDWQWFSLDTVPVASPTAARRILNDVVSEPECHRFLRQSFSDLYEPAFKIEPMHEHCRAVDITHDFDGILARAATDRLGAYSRELVDAPASAWMAVRRILGPVFPFSVFSLQPGDVTTCPVCAKYNNHLFTNWFYGVAWDWCFCLLSHEAPTAWVGCLTDTD
jgi:hypothetical protein